MFSLYLVIQISCFLFILCYKFHVFALSCVTIFMFSLYPVLQISCFRFILCYKFMFSLYPVLQISCFGIILCYKFHVFALSCVTNFHVFFSSKLTVLLELHSRKTVCFSEQIMSADKYLSIFARVFGRQMEAIVIIIWAF